MHRDRPAIVGEQTFAALLAVLLRELSTEQHTSIGEHSFLAQTIVARHDDLGYIDVTLATGKPFRVWIERLDQ